MTVQDKVERAIQSRFKAGESLSSLAYDYEMEEHEIAAIIQKVPA